VVVNSPSTVIGTATVKTNFIPSPPRIQIDFEV
jgi:hypothetical protein